MTLHHHPYHVHVRQHDDKQQQQQATSNKQQHIQALVSHAHTRTHIAGTLCMSTRVPRGHVVAPCVPHGSPRLRADHTRGCVVATSPPTLRPCPVAEAAGAPPHGAVWVPWAAPGFGQHVRRAPARPRWPVATLSTSWTRRAGMTPWHRHPAVPNSRPSRLSWLDSSESVETPVSATHQHGLCLLLQHFLVHLHLHLHHRVHRQCRGFVLVLVLVSVLVRVLPPATRCRCAV